MSQPRLRAVAAATLLADLFDVETDWRDTGVAPGAGARARRGGCNRVGERRS